MKTKCHLDSLITLLAIHFLTLPISIFLQVQTHHPDVLFVADWIFKSSSRCSVCSRLNLQLTIQIFQLNVTTKKLIIQKKAKVCLIASSENSLRKIATYLRKSERELFENNLELVKKSSVRKLQYPL